MAGYSQSEAELHLGDGATPTEVFAAIAQVLSMTPPTINKTNTKRYVFGSTDPLVFVGRPEDQTVAFELAMDGANATHDQFADDALASSPAARNYRVIWPDGAQWAFSAKVTAFAPGEMSADSSDPFTVSVTLTLESAVTLTPPA